MSNRYISHYFYRASWTIDLIANCRNFHYLQTSGIIYFYGELEERLCSLWDDLKWMHNSYL
jgi:hypothetical protein